MLHPRDIGQARTTPMTGATVNTAAFFASLAKLVAAVTDKVLNETKPHIPSTDLAAPEIDLIVNSRATKHLHT